MQTDVIARDTGKVIIKYVLAITTESCTVNSASQAVHHLRPVHVERLHFHCEVVSCVSYRKNTTSAACHEGELHRRPVCASSHSLPSLMDTHKQHIIDRL